jgi:hypothetical protein
MFVINDDLTIECTRGDVAYFSVGANIGGSAYRFHTGDVVRFSVFEKKDCSKVVLRKDVEAGEETELVEIELTSEDTRIGEVISKPVDYWYEVELNPDGEAQTIIGYDKDGAKVFKLYPESEV